MANRWRPALAAFLATGVLAAGIVIVVLSQQQQAATPSSAPATTYLATVLTATVRPVPRTGSGHASAVARPPDARPSRRPTLTVDSGCRPGGGPDRLTDVPAAVRQRVDAAWERIERWLLAHAPATAATLAGPASTEDILAAQRESGIALPADLVASLQRHNGAATGQAGRFTFPPFYDPLSAKGIGDQVRMMCDVLASLGQDDLVGYWWHGQFLPFAIDNGGGSLLLDQRDGAARLGKHFNEDSVSFDGLPGSLTELLERTADVLEGKIPALLHSRPSVTPKGTLDWEIAR